jgi:hypothetical protein
MNLGEHIIKGDLLHVKRKNNSYKNNSIKTIWLPSKFAGPNIKE